ncbi:MAG: DUF2752 domain-containing protein [Muribaculaceae bacterium]|nr:DUF2752 domain-containing protein [Muribaculaceae bacterium]
MPTLLSTRRLLIIVAVMLCIIYFIFDPAQSAWMPKCMFHLITGWDCPGCGSQRMGHALLHLDLRGAWRANALLLCALPYLIFWLYIELTPRRNPAHPRYHAKMQTIHQALNSRTAVIIITLTLIAWTLIRNLSA